MKLKQCILALVAVLSSFALTTYALVAVESDDNVAKIGDVAYSTFGAAMEAAKGMTGDVTVEIYGPVEFVDGMELNGNYTSIKFVGKDSDAQMTINQTAGGDYLTAHGKTVTFEGLSLAKANPAWSGNSGHMGNYFSVQGGEVTYEGCTFPNGACTSGGTALYSGCTFQNASEYGLWVYDDALVTVDGGTIDSKKGIKVYSEDESSVTSTLTVKNATFTENVTAKPAVAVGYAASVTLIGNTYNNTTAHIELDSGSDANCEGVTLVAQDANGNDIASTLNVTDRNKSQAPCGVLVDGKIYTSATTAAEAATAGSNVTLLYASSETVEFAEGVTLDKNGFTADGVTVTVVAPVSVTTFAELKAAVEAGKSVILANDITTTAAIVTAGVTSEIDLNGKTLTIGAGDNKFNEASNVTIKNGTINITGLTVSGNAVFCLDEYETTLVTTVTLDEVNVVGNGYSSAYCIFYIGKSSVLNVKGGEWNLTNDASTAGGVFKADASTAILNIDGLKLTAHNVRRGVTYAATTIANSTIAFSGDADGVDAEMEHGFNHSPLTITNSTITMTDMVGRGITAENGAVTISENSTVTMTNCQEATIDVRNGQTVTVDNTSTVTVDAEPTITSGNIDGTVTVTTAGVAKIGETTYPTLQAAIDAATAGATITVLSDITLTEGITIPADKTIVLDLAGYTISQVKAQTAGYQMILNDGNLTIDDSSDAKTGTISYTDSGNGGEYISDVIYNRGVLVINGGTIENLSSATVATNGYPHAVDTYSGIRNTSVTINGGTIKCASYSAIRMFCVSATHTADLVINGGTVMGAIDMQNGTKNAALGSLTINDGNFLKNASKANIRFANWNGGATEYGITGEITGGTFDAGINTNYVPAAANFDKGIISGGTFGVDVTEYCAEGLTAADGCAALPDLNGNYVVGVKPTATVNKLGAMTIAEADYTVYGGSKSGDMPLSFVMQFLADQTEEDMATSPYADWYGDFVITFSGIEDDKFTADGCYLAGYYGDFGWVKVPVDGMEIENGVRYPVMLGVGMGQKYDYICSDVKDFRCAMYLTPEVLEANPNLKVTLELAVVDNSKGEDAAKEALISGDNTYQVVSTDYTASDFAAPVAKIGEVEYKTLQAAIDAAQNGETITLVADVELCSSVEVSGKTVTLDLGEYTILDKSTAVLTPKSNIWGLIEVKNNADITICGTGTIKCNYANVSGGWTGMAYAVNVDATSKLTVNSGNFINGNGGVQTRGEAVVNGGTFVSHNGGTCIMAVDSDAKVTINGGSFKDAVDTSDAYTGSGAVWGGFGATIEINGGTYDFAADPENGNVVWTLFPAQNAIAGYGENANMTVKGGTFVNFNPATDVVVDYSQSAGFTMGGVVADGYAALSDLNGNYVVGAKPTATVNNLGAMTIAEADYMVYGGSKSGDMPLSFVMQFLADQTEADMATSPYADWYGDFVITFEGLEGNFVADGCYLAGYYGDFGWVKVPVDGMTIEEGVRYPVMLGVGMGQKYDYICSDVKDFRCAMYLTPEVLEANPNLKVTLELAVVDNSKGEDAAKEALINNTNVYQVGVTDYTASDFAAPVAKIGEVEYKTLQAAIDAAQVGETITVLRDITLTEGVTVAADDEITLNLNGMTISQEKECTASYQMIQNNGSLTITGDGKISFKDTSAGDSSFGWGSYTINNRGTLVVENGTIEHLGEQEFATHMICAIQQGAGSTTINGGTISTPNYRSVRINAGSLTINGGELDGQVWLQPNQGDATLDVTGGTFGPNGRDASSIFMENKNESHTVSSASISGGTFTTKIGCSDASKLAGTISGGSFSAAAVSGTNTDLLVAGYEFETEADANGYYGIEWTGNVDELVIVDGELTEFVNEQEMTIGKLTYKRTLSSESYNALYVPFEIPVDSLSDNYDVFYIYDVRSYDNDEDGTPDDWDMEVFKFNKGTLKANYPYFIRPKSTAALDMVLTLEDATLCKSEEKSVVCSSVFMTYEVKGLYHKVESGELYGHYGISNKGRWIPIRNAVLSPFRFHLKMTNNDGSSVNVSEEALSSMRIRVIGEGSTTDIEHLKQESNRPAKIYDMQGRRVQTPAKGFYIVNGKKVYIK